MQSGYDINDLVREAQTRWLKPAEVLFILQNHGDHQLTHEPPQKPASGSLFLFNKRVLRFFRKDGHSWRKKKDGRTVGEAHERLKVGNVEALNCYYAHGEQNPNFQRRSYWMLDPVFEHIVLVHYRDINEGRQIAGLSPLSSSTFSQSLNSYTSQHAGSSVVIGGSQEPVHSISSPGSIEINSDLVTKSNRDDYSDVIHRTKDADNMSRALRRLEEQLSLNDDTFEEIAPFYSETGDTNDFESFMHKYSSSAQVQDDPDNHLKQTSGNGTEQHHQLADYEVNIWKETLDNHTWSPDVDSRVKQVPDINENGLLFASSTREPVKEQESYNWLNFAGKSGQKSSVSNPQEIEAVNYPPYYPATDTYGTDPDQYTTMFDGSQIGASLHDDQRVTIAQKQKFSIREVSPEWGYASEQTKVIIIGSFLCDSSECAWACMFGDAEVPIEIIQEGVIRCQAPPHMPGKVSLCITAGNRESCSEIREFEYRLQPCSNAQNNLPEKSAEEQLLLVRFVQMLLSDVSTRKQDTSKLGTSLFGNPKLGEDSWSQVIEALLVGTSTFSSTTEWLLQELLKDKLHQWLSVRQQEDQETCSLSKKEQGIIHMIAGLGFEWALHPILNSGVNVNFRDINGWTGLHWAARFGREKMVASLIASGASAGAVTDPSPQDPTGKTPAAIAATCGHKGLAGYLSEVALTSHLSSLKLEESELSKGSADLEAERRVNSISSTTTSTNEDQLSLKDTLAAVRNAAQAAARIQSAFRAHSFRRRQQKEAAASLSGDEYEILSNDIQGISAASRLAFRNARDYNSAALSIQKKYRGWKGRKDFLAFRQKVVKIQAHVRGYQVRKNYKVCWAVGVLEKVVLRWRRRGVGLRGFRHESEFIDETESEEEDILRMFRKQKVDTAIDEAVSRVLSMVESPEARQQYRRILEKYRQAKAELVGTQREMTESQGDIAIMDSNLSYQLM